HSKKRPCGFDLSSSRPCWRGQAEPETSDTSAQRLISVMHRGVLGPPAIVLVSHASRNAIGRIIGCHAYLENAGKPLSEFGVAVSPGKTAVPNVVRTGHVGPNGRVIVHLQITVIHAAHVLFEEYRGVNRLKHSELSNFGEGFIIWVIAPG